MGTVNRTISKSVIFLISGYQYLVSPLFGQCCRFYPSCSSYSIKALQLHGTLRGSSLALRRILRCHPWHEGGYDPVPEQHTLCKPN